jgi:hypothetical protein
MIRTKIVELNVIEGIAYRQKLKGGKTGLVVMKFGLNQPGMAILDRSTGRPVLPSNAPKAIPHEAYLEAKNLTDGMTYARHHKFAMLGGSMKKVENEEFLNEEPEAELEVVCSSDYQKIIDQFKDKRGDFSYLLLNRDFVKFAKSSSIVAKMVQSKASVEDIRKHVVRARFETITGNSKLSDGQIDQIVQLLDEVQPRGVFKKLNDEIRKMLA